MQAEDRQSGETCRLSRTRHRVCAALVLVAAGQVDNVQLTEIRFIN